MYYDKVLIFSIGPDIGHWETVITDFTTGPKLLLDYYHIFITNIQIGVFVYSVCACDNL